MARVVFVARLLNGSLILWMLFLLAYHGGDITDVGDMIHFVLAFGAPILSLVALWPRRQAKTN